MHACITVMGVPDEPIGDERSAMSAITLPLAKIAEKLGVRSVGPDDAIPPGIWVCDGSGNGRAYDYIDLVDKMTERMSK